MHPMNKFFLKVIHYLLLVLIISGCSIALDEPSRVVDKYLRASVVNDLATLQEVIDPDYQEQVMQAIFFQIGLSAFVGGAQGEYTELKLQTISNDGQSAIVRAVGKLKMVTFGTPMTVPVDVQIPLVRKNGTWYVTIPEVISP